MKSLLLAAVGAACVLAGVGAAQAAPLPANGMTVKEVQTWLLDSGYKAEKAKDGEDEYLRSAADGVNFEVHFYDCKKDRCASIQMIAGFDLDEKLTWQKANGWNSGKRFVNCFLDEDGDPWFSYDINLSPGGTREALDDNFGVWLMFLPDMKEVAGWK